MSVAAGFLTLSEAFEATVALAPGRIAVRSPHEELTYGEVNASANRIARALLDRLIGTGRPPAVLLLSHGGSTVVGSHGAVKAALPVLSVDPASPPDRIESIVRNSGAGVILGDASTREQARTAASRAGIPLVDVRETEGYSEANLGLAIDPDWTATIVYTSGSTGSPKGVARTHRHHMQTPMLEPRSRDQRPDDRELALTRASFAASSRGVYSVLLAGATLYPFRVEDGLTRLVAWMRSERITIYHSVPALFREVMRAAGSDVRFPDVRFVRIGGDTVFRSDFDLFRRHFVEGSIFRINLGLSEAGGVASYLADHSSDPGQDHMPVGTPMPGVEVRLIGDDGREVPAGEVGEIEVTSRNLPSGYWRNPELTAARYRDDPRGLGWRIVRTGDLGRWREDGLLEHRGRIDFQVKIRGQRVDTTEVEALLRREPSISDSVVVARRDGGAEDRLVAYVRVPGDSRPSRTALRQRLREKLPGAAIPAAFVFLDSLPKTSAGKTDRRTLPVPLPSDFGDEAEIVAPRDESEAALLEIWRRILPGSVASIRESFFELGGDSLNAAELLLEIERRWKISLALPVLLEASTIEQLAAVIRASPSAPAERSPMVALRAEGSRTPLFCVPGGNGPGFNLRTIAGLLGPDQPVFAFHVSIETGETRPASTGEWADRFFPHLRRQQPHGPYQLIGHSSGGHIVWEIARRLIDQSEVVRFVALLDTFAPGYPRRLSRPERWAQLWTDFLSRSGAEQARTIRRTLRRWSARRTGQARATAGAPPTRLPGRGAFRSGTGGYHHAPLAAPVILFRARDRQVWRGVSFKAKDNNWGPLAGQNLVVEPVAGDHNTLLEGDGAVEVANFLSRYLA